MEVDISFSGSYNSVTSSGSNELETDLGREALKEICCSSLSRILDLSDNKLEILLGEDEQQEEGHSSTSGHNVAKNIANKLKALSHRLRFDDNHSTTISTDTLTDSKFPTLHFKGAIDINSQEVIIKLITHVENYCNEEGLFRKPGSRSRVDSMINELQTIPFESIITNTQYGPADYASVLKTYFTDLPEPLMLTRHLEAYKQASVMDENKQTLCLQLLILLLPPTHHIILCHLLHLLSVISQSQTSLMCSRNLAVVFGPTLFLDMTNQDNMMDGGTLQMITSLLEHMINHNIEIFEIPTEVRLVAEKYMKRREISEDTDSVPVDIYSSACKRTSGRDYHEEGKENALAELASLYEYVKKLPDGPQKQHFLKKFESGSKIAGTPPPYIKTKKTKENRATPKLPKGVGSHEIATPMRPSFNKGYSSLVTSGIPSYATPLRPKPNNRSEEQQEERMETDV